MRDFEIEIEPGIWLDQKLIPVANVDCYIPGGKYPRISAAIMSIGTAKAAGVDHVIACAPPRGSEGIYPPQLYALRTAGADEVYVLGGARALAAMAFGCAGMHAVDTITGLGNPCVAEAKRQLFGQVGIDLLAGLARNTWSGTLGVPTWQRGCSRGRPRLPRLSRLIGMGRLTVFSKSSLADSCCQ